jgi:outer membrane lipoprotein SlyB
MKVANISIMLVTISLAFNFNVEAKKLHEIVYGNVSSVLITTADSKILEGTIAGGALGLAIGDSVIYTLNGAALGFAITSILEGIALRYKLKVNM